MGCAVSHFPDEIHPKPEVSVHDVTEFFRIHEVDQLIIPGHDERAVHGVHPFDSEFHCSPTIEDGGRHIDWKDLLRRDCDVGKVFKFLFGF